MASFSTSTIPGSGGEFASRSVSIPSEVLTLAHALCSRCQEFCKALFEYRARTDRTKFYAGRRIRVRETGTGKHQDIRLIFHDGAVYVAINPGHPTDRYSLYLSALDVACPWQVFPTLPLPRRKRLGMLPLQWVLDSIRDCALSHGCGSTEETVLPTRVVDIGNPFQIRLINSNGARGKYVCLSHCWGGYQPLKTTKDNLNSHFRSIPLSSIPRTYQDAIEFTQSLAIRYLWIDSLCIIQDDTVDWEQQSALMCNIYENCYIVIAATSAKDATEGFLRRKERIEFEIRGTTTSRIPFRIVGQGALPHLEGGHFSLDGCWPLFERAWFWQERLLAPRVVHFNTDELLWECRERVECQCGGFFSKTKIAHSWIYRVQPKDELVVGWTDLVSSFSGLHLSHEADKLPAISGLATQMAKRRPGAKYLAGLWEDSLEVDLLWISLELFEDKWRPRPQIWRAPSWSWASVNSQVYYNFARYHQMVLVYFNISKAQTCLATLDITGQVKSAILTITGSTFPAILEQASESPSSERPSWTLRVEGTQDVFRSPVSQHEYFMAGDKVYFDDPSGLLQSNYSPGCLHLIPMARARFDIMGLFVEEVEYSLVIHCPDPSFAKCTRIGMALQPRRSGMGGREISPSWLEKPSFFETGGVRRTVTIL